MTRCLHCTLPQCSSKCKIDVSLRPRILLCYRPLSSLSMSVLAGSVILQVVTCSHRPNLPQSRFAHQTADSSLSCRLKPFRIPQALCKSCSTSLNAAGGKPYPRWYSLWSWVDFGQHSHSPSPPLARRSWVMNVLVSSVMNSPPKRNLQV